MAFATSTSLGQSHQNFLDNFDHTNNGHQEDFNSNLGGRDLTYNFKRGNKDLLSANEGDYIDYEDIPEHERKHIVHQVVQQVPKHHQQQQKHRPQHQYQQRPQPQNEEFILDDDYEYEVADKPDEKLKDLNRPVRQSLPHGFHDFKSHFPDVHGHVDVDHHADPYSSVHVAHHEPHHVLPPPKNTYHDPHAESPHHGFDNFKPLDAIRNTFGGIPGLHGQLIFLGL